MGGRLQHFNITSALPVKSSDGAHSRARGLLLVLKALETAPVSYVVSVRQLSVLFALVLGVVLLRERPDRARTLGAMATVVGVALIALFP